MTHIHRLIQGIAGNDDIGAGAGGPLDGFHVNTAIHSNIHWQCPSPALFGMTLRLMKNFRDLWQDFLHEHLAAEPGMYGHAQYFVKRPPVGIKGPGRGFRIQSQSGPHAFRADTAQSVGHVALQFDMDQERICPGLDKLIHKMVGPGQHEMHAERYPDTAMRHTDDVRSHTDIRHKMAVHDIQMQGIPTRGLGLQRRFLETAEISSQQGRQYGNSLFHFRSGNRSTWPGRTQSNDSKFTKRSCFLSTFLYK